MRFEINESRLQGVFSDPRGNLYTQTLSGARGISVYGERLIKTPDGEFRSWDHTRSKLGAGIKKGISQIGIRPGSVVLYLGCSTGTTVSHVSDIVGPDGIVFALDVAPRVMRDLLFVAASRPNIYPIMADANRPQTFMQQVPMHVDVVFMDVAQPNQSQIFLANCHVFLKPGGFGLLALKSRSVDIRKSSRAIFEETRVELEKEMMLVDQRSLEPFEQDHQLFVCKKK